HTSICPLTRRALTPPLIPYTTLFRSLHPLLPAGGPRRPPHHDAAPHPLPTAHPTRTLHAAGPPGSHSRGDDRERPHHQRGVSRQSGRALAVRPRHRERLRAAPDVLGR